MKSFAALAMALMVVVVLPAYAQIPTSPFPTNPTPTSPFPTNPTPVPSITQSPCTSSMLTSFTPCVNYLTNSTGAPGSSPTSDCCTALRSLMTNGTGCLCQIAMGGVPFRIPINRTMAIALPKACNQASVPFQCKASAGAPVPASAPGPAAAAFGPSASPAAAVSPSAGTIPAAETPALSPVSDTTPSSEGSLPPTPTSKGTGSSPTPSAAMPSLSISPSLLFSVAIMIMKCF